jgi:uncharacterized damage-inducible protein DinB
MNVKILLLLLLVSVLPAHAQQKPAPTLRSILLEQLKTTHNQEDWFVPANIAIQGLTAEQASWRDGKENHSIGQLAAHLVFWNRQNLAKFNGEPPEKFSGNNNETFETFDAKNWSAIVKDLDEVLTAWERAVESADDAKLNSWASTIAHIGTHNAYHTGQILYIRKQQGSWNSANGVK